MNRCQICGRKKGQRKDGGIVHHHVRGDVCPGKGHPPIEEDDAALAAEAARQRALQRQHSRAIRDLVDRRANYIDPALQKAERAAWAAADKLERRLKRHRDWPARYHRQMEKYGMAMRPPPYLLLR